MLGKLQPFPSPKLETPPAEITRGRQVMIERRSMSSVARDRQHAWIKQEKENIIYTDPSTPR